MSEAEPSERSDIPTVISGTPTDDELAAIAAVFAHLSLEHDIRVQRVPPTARPSAWSRTLRLIRLAPQMHTDWSDPII